MTKYAVRFAKGEYLESFTTVPWECTTTREPRRAHAFDSMTIAHCVAYCIDQGEYEVVTHEPEQHTFNFHVIQNNR